jgi:uncharacterized membrane protein YraQ (UPF0718 family)
MQGRQIIARVLAGIGVAIVIGYSFFVIEDFARGPRIIITTPETGFATTTEYLTILGRAVHTNSLFLNDTAIPFDLEGNFRESLLLAEGYNIMRIKAEDRYKRTVEKTIEITLLRTATTTPSVATTSQPLINI